MADFAGRLGGAAGLAEFVVRPEGAVEEDDVGRGSQFLPFRVAASERRSDEDLLTAALEQKTDGRVFGGGVAPEFLAQVVGIVAVEGNRVADKRRRFARAFREMAAEAAPAR